MSTVVEKEFFAVFSDETNMKAAYHVTLKNEMFSRFFSVLKVAGAAQMKINDNDMIDMDYVVEKCPHITMFIETNARSV